jgi:hypothetical protein
MTRYKIEQQCWHGWDVFGYDYDDETGNETPATYPTREAAQAALIEFFDVIGGDYAPDDFRIMEVKQ